MNTMTLNALAQRVFAAIATLTILQIIAQTYELYWIFPNLDRPMHFLGGVWLGLLVTWLLARFRLVRHLATMGYVWAVLGLSLLLGLGWEGFEFGLSHLVDSGINLQPSPIDTMLDLVLDMLGAMVVALWFMMKKYVIVR